MFNSAATSAAGRPTTTYSQQAFQVFGENSACINCSARLTKWRRYSASSKTSGGAFKSGKNVNDGSGRGTQEGGRKPVTQKDRGVTFQVTFRSNGVTFGRFRAETRHFRKQFLCPRGSGG